MVRVINQETYDDIVKENMEEFDMSPQEAIKEAVAQFEAQGVDLSNIIKDLILSSGDNHIVTTTINKLKELSARDDADDKAIIKELDVLKEECKKDMAHRIKAGKDGAYTVLIDLLEKRTKYYMEKSKESDIVIVKGFKVLCALMEMHPDLLDSRGANLIKSVLDQINNDEILAATLKWTAVCCIKHENNRQTLFSKNIIENCHKIITENKNKKVLSETLQAMRKLTLDDDIRVEFGKAHDHAKEMGLKLLGPLTKLLKENLKTTLVSDLLLTISCLLVRHELCKAASEDGVGALFDLLPTVYDDVTTTQYAITLITALAGNDDVKRDLVKSGMVPIIVSLLNRHSSNATAAAAILKCISALSLREPEHSRQFIDSGVCEPVVDCLKIHQNNSNVVKNACWAIRNLMTRSRDQNSKFLELGVEAILNSCYDKYCKEFGYDIKSALRELDCDVKLDEQWTGKGVQMQQ